MLIVMTIQAKLKLLRKEMKSAAIDALILPANDPHQSEYVAPCWQVRQYFSGFTGSAGLLVVLQDYAALWTDSRYFLQAEMELKGSGIVLHRQQVQHAPEHLLWLQQTLNKQAVVGVEASLFSIQQIVNIQTVFQTKGIAIKNVEGICSRVWKDRQGLPSSKVYEHDVKYTGLSRQQKIDDLRIKMQAQGAEHYFIAALDEIAWLLNIRAWDIDYTPVALSYCMVSTHRVDFFIQDFKLPAALKQTLAAAAIYCHDYHAVASKLMAVDKNETIYVDKASLSWHFHELIEAKLLLGTSLIMPSMAIKNEIELGHIRAVMIKDGLALTQFFKWLEERVASKPILESEVAEKLTSFRAAQADYVGDSFASIVGYKSNAAIVHYRAKEATAASIHPDGMLLIDSGGQYLNGTTDITRMFFLGEADAVQKKHYTLVLKGNIALQTAHFPKGTTGVQLDVLARMNLWNEGLNYGHGTGHGVGFFLRVHEPPQGFAESTTTTRGSTALEAGTVSSNEPGFYKTGAYGIRIENLMLCKPSALHPDFLCFEVLTLFPIETSLIDISSLTTKEIDWLNRYHEKVYASLSPFLEETVKTWLFAKCQPI
jgi:Xaa-Pro aminopeptidase